MNNKRKKPVRSVDMATKPQVNRRSHPAYHPADYRVDVVGLGEYVRGSSALAMRHSDAAVLERRLEPQPAAPVRFVGEVRSKRPSKKYYSVDLDDFQR
jgi:hypothetical protein